MACPHMTYKSNRRTFLKGVTAAGIGVAAMPPATADDEVRYIVTGGNPDQLEREGYTVIHEITGANVYLVYGPADEDPSAVGGVDGAFEDFEYEIDLPAAEGADEDGDLTDNQWDKEITEAFEAHETATGAGTRLGVLDTGVDHTHPDLDVDTETSRTFLGWEENEHAGDAREHGTHVAGIAGADGAIVGTAPDADLVSLRVFGETGGASVGDSFLALDYTTTKEKAHGLAVG